MLLTLACVCALRLPSRAARRWFHSLADTVTLNLMAASPSLGTIATVAVLTNTFMTFPVFVTPVLRILENLVYTPENIEEIEEVGPISEEALFRESIIQRLDSMSAQIEVNATVLARLAKKLDVPLPRHEDPDTESPADDALNHSRLALAGLVSPKAGRLRASGGRPGSKAGEAMGENSAKNCSRPSAGRSGYGSTSSAVATTSTLVSPRLTSTLPPSLPSAMWSGRGSSGRRPSTRTFFSRARRMRPSRPRGSSRPKALGGFGSSIMMARASWMAVSPSKGFRPVASS